jgi:hypothetical protein
MRKETSMKNLKLKLKEGELEMSYVRKITKQKKRSGYVYYYIRVPATYRDFAKGKTFAVILKNDGSIVYKPSEGEEKIVGVVKANVVKLTWQEIVKLPIPKGVAVKDFYEVSFDEKSKSFILRPVEVKENEHQNEQNKD